MEHIVLMALIPFFNVSSDVFDYVKGEFFTNWKSIKLETQYLQYEIIEVERTEKDKKYIEMISNIDTSDKDDYYLGDVVVSKDQAERQAKEYGHSIEEEIAKLVEHGVLHLFGIHHEDSSEK